MKNKQILKITSLVLLLTSFVIPMYNIYPNGLFIIKDSWFFIKTFDELINKGIGAFNYIGVVLHLAIWISSIGICIGAFDKRYKIVRFFELLGIVLLLIGLLISIIITGKMDIIHPLRGYVCIGYWIDLFLLVMCLLHSLKNN